MRKAGFVTVVIFLQRRVRNGSIFWLIAVEWMPPPLFQPVMKEPPSTSDSIRTQTGNLDRSRKSRIGHFGWSHFGTAFFHGVTVEAAGAGVQLAVAITTLCTH